MIKWKPIGDAWWCEKTSYQAHNSCKHLLSWGILRSKLLQLITRSRVELLVLSASAGPEDPICDWWKVLQPYARGVSLIPKRTKPFKTTGFSGIFCGFLLKNRLFAKGIWDYWKLAELQFSIHLRTSKIKNTHPFRKPSFHPSRGHLETAILLLLPFRKYFCLLYSYLCL